MAEIAWENYIHRQLIVNCVVKKMHTKKLVILLVKELHIPEIFFIYSIKSTEVGLSIVPHPAPLIALKSSSIVERINS